MTYRQQRYFLLIQRVADALVNRRVTWETLMPEHFKTYLASLDEAQLEVLITWLDSMDTYESVCRWIDKERPTLARRLFGDPHAT